MADHDGTGPDWPQDGEPSADDERRRPTRDTDAASEHTGPRWANDDWDADAWELIDDPGLIGSTGSERGPRRSRRHTVHTDDDDDQATRAAATRMLDLDALVDDALVDDALVDDAPESPPHRRGPSWPRARGARPASTPWGDTSRRDHARAPTWPESSTPPDADDTASEGGSTEPELTAHELDAEPTPEVWSSPGARQRHDALGDDDLETQTRPRATSTQSEVIELGLSDVLDAVSSSEIIELDAVDAHALETDPSETSTDRVDDIEELDSDLLVALEPEPEPVRGAAARVVRTRPLPAATAAAVADRSEILPTRIYQSRDEPAVQAAPSPAAPVSPSPAAARVSSQQARQAEVREARSRLSALLDRIAASTALNTLGRYTRMLVDELVDELRSASGEPSDGLRVHELAEMLVDATRARAEAEVEPLDESVVAELEAIAAVLDPALNAAHHAMLAAAWRRRAVGESARASYRESLRRFAAHLAELVGEQPALGAALAAAWSELAMLEEVEGGVDAVELEAPLRDAARVAGGYALPVLMRVRNAIQRASRAEASARDQRRVHEALADLVRLSSSPFQGVVALEHLRRVWRAGASPQTLVAIANDQLAHTDRDGAYPYALQLVAWDIGDTDLEIEVSRSRIGALIAATKRASVAGADKHHRRTLKRRIVGLFLRLHALYASAGREAEAAQALDDGLKVAPRSLIALRAARRLAEQRGDWARVDALLERELATIASGDHRAALCHMRARLAIERFDDLAAARERLLEALEASPSYVPPAIELGRIFLQAHHYEPLYELWSSLRHSDAAPSLRWSDDAAEHRRGELLETLLEDDAGAFDAYREALAARPAEIFLIEGCARTGYATGRYGELADLFLAASRETDDRLRQSAFALRAAQLREREVGDIDGAIEAWLCYLELDPTDLDGLRSLVALYRRAGYRREALALLEQLVELEIEPGELRAQREWLGYLVAQADDIEPARARQALDALVANTPDSVTAQVLLRSTLLEARDWHGLETLCEELAVDGEVGRRRDLLLQAALVARGQLNDNARARRHLEQARELDPGSGPTLDLLEEVYTEQGDDEALVELLADRARAVDGVRAADLYAQAANLCVDVLDDQARAAELYSDALDAAPGHAIAWTGLTGILHAHGAWTELERQIESRLTHVDDRGQRVALLRELAFVQRVLLGQRAQTGATLRALLEVAPDDLVGLQALCELCEVQGDRHGALEMHGRIADIVVDPADRIEHLRAQCRLHLELHGRLPWDRIERILSIDPQHPDVARFLSTVEVGIEGRPRLIELLSRLEAPRFAPDAALASLRLATLLEEAGRLDEARERYAAVAETSPALLPARLGLLRVLDALGELEASAEVCLALADDVDDAALRLPLVRAAAQQLGRAGRDAAMAAAWERLLHEVPDDEEAFTALREHYQRAGDVDGLGRLLAGRIDDASVAARIEMLRQMTSLEHVEPGNAAYRAALEDLAALAPRDLETQRRLAAYDELEGEATVAAARWERVLDLTRDLRVRRRVALHAARLWLEQGQRPDQAIALCRELIAEGAATGDGDHDTEPLRLLARAQGAAGRVDDAIASWRSLFERSSSTAGRVEAGLALGRLHRDGTGDRAAAAQWFVAVVELDPACEAATEALLALGRQRERAPSARQLVAKPGDDDTTRLDSYPPRPEPSTSLPFSGNQLDKAIAAQLDALAGERWAIARYEQLARLMLLRDRRDPRLTLLCTLLRHFGRLDHELAAHLDAAEPRWQRGTDAARPVGARDYQRLLLHADCRVAIHELFARVGEVLGRLTGPSLDAVGRGMDQALAHDDPDQISATIQGHAWLLGMQAPVLRLHAGDVDALELVFDPEPALVLGRCVVGSSSLASQARVQAFRVGWALEGLRDAKAVAIELGAARVATILGAALGELFPDLSLRLVSPSPGEEDPEALETGRHLARALPRRKRRELRRLAEQTAATHHDVARWCRGLEHTRARAALIDCMDLGVACSVLCPEHLERTGRAERLAALTRVDTLTDLLEFATSDELAELLGPQGGGSTR